MRGATSDATYQQLEVSVPQHMQHRACNLLDLDPDILEKLLSMDSRGLQNPFSLQHRDFIALRSSCKALVTTGMVLDAFEDGASTWGWQSSWLWTGQKLYESRFLDATDDFTARWWRCAGMHRTTTIPTPMFPFSPAKSCAPAFFNTIYRLELFLRELSRLGDGKSITIAGSFPADLLYARKRNGWWVNRVNAPSEWDGVYPPRNASDMDVYVKDASLIPSVCRLSYQLLSAIHPHSPIEFQHGNGHAGGHDIGAYPDNARVLDYLRFPTPLVSVYNGTVLNNYNIRSWEEEFRAGLVDYLDTVMPENNFFPHILTTVPRAKISMALEYWHEYATYRAGLPQGHRDRWDRSHARLFKTDASTRVAVDSEMPAKLCQKPMVLGIRPRVKATSPYENDEQGRIMHWQTRHEFGITLPYEVQVIHQVNHPDCSNACPTNFFDLVQCMVALHPTDGPGLKMTYSRDTLTCLLTGACRLSPYAFDINGMVNSLVQDHGADALLSNNLRTMGDDIWKQIAQHAVPKFAARVRKYRNKGFRHNPPVLMTGSNTRRAWETLLTNDVNDDPANETGRVCVVPHGLQF